MSQVFKALLPALFLVSTGLGAGAVVLVTDVSGRVVLESRDVVRLMDGIPAGKALVLARGSRLSLLDLATGEELAYHGPCRLRLGEKGRPQGAKPASMRPVAAAQGALRLGPDRLVLAGVPMRGPEDAEGAELEVAPRGPVLLADAPRFDWKAEASARFRFRLYDGAGNILHELSGEGHALQLPRLEVGKRHIWILESGVPGRPPQVASGRFRVLEAPAREQLERVRPGTGADFSERLVFAALLEDLGIRDEARRMWGGLAAERPGEGRLKELAH